MCVSGIMSASCKRSYIMCVSTDRNVSGHTLCVLAVSCPHYVLREECKWSYIMCVSGIMSALRQECKWSYIMCVSGIMSALRHDRLHMCA